MFWATNMKHLYPHYTEAEVGIFKADILKMAAKGGKQNQLFDLNSNLDKPVI